jgi:hypothetical protein
VSGITADRYVFPHEVLGNHREQTQQSWLVVGAACQRLIRTGEQSGLLTHIVMTESVSLRTDEKVTAFLKLESVVQACGKFA